MDKRLLKERFWDMFIVDTLIGNWDRHNGNWGMLYDENTGDVSLASVFDCGSSLYPQADDGIMRSVLESDAERNLRIYEIPTSIIKINNRKIRYFDFVSSLQNPDCSAALRRIVPRIDMSRIDDIVENTPFLSNLQKDFCRLMLRERKSRIPDYSLSMLQSRQQRHSEIPSGSTD